MGAGLGSLNSHAELKDKQPEMLPKLLASSAQERGALRNIQKRKRKNKKINVCQL